MKDEKTGQEFDYSRKQGVEETFILAPENTPDLLKDRETLWNKVEQAEKRKDAQLAREFTIALPAELSKEEQKDLVKDWVNSSFVSKGMIADVAIHAPSKEGDDRNHHAHIMLTMREIEGEGFGKKNRDWNDKEQLKAWRESWSVEVNKALEKAGVEERIDHRSNKERGIEALPQKHVGVHAMAMERKAKRAAIQREIEYEPVTDRGRQNAEIQEANRLKELAIKAIEEGWKAIEASQRALRELAERAHRAFELLRQQVDREKQAKKEKTARNRAIFAKAFAEKRERLERERWKRENPSYEKDDGGMER